MTGSDEEQASKRPVNGPQVQHAHNGATDSEDGEIQLKRLAPDVIPVQASEHIVGETPPYMNGTFSEGDSLSGTDSGEEMSTAPHRPLHPPPQSKYTDRGDVVSALYR